MKTHSDSEQDRAIERERNKEKQKEGGRGKDKDRERDTQAERDDEGQGTGQRDCEKQRGMQIRTERQRRKQQLCAAGQRQRKKTKRDRKQGTGTARQRKGQVERQRKRALGKREGQGAERHDRQESYGEAKKITQRGRGGAPKGKRGDTAPRAWDSPQLPLSALPGKFYRSGTSFPVCLSFPPFLLCSSTRLPVLASRAAPALTSAGPQREQRLHLPRLTWPPRAPCPGLQLPAGPGARLLPACPGALLPAV